mgnify:CR=1 FL=1
MSVSVSVCVWLLVVGEGVSFGIGLSPAGVMTRSGSVIVRPRKAETVVDPGMRSGSGTRQKFPKSQIRVYYVLLFEPISVDIYVYTILQLLYLYFM